MAIGTMQSASNQKMDFMNLLVTQLQNQNPLEPMDNQDMSAQLAQFSQLEQMENLNTSFNQVLENTERSFANDMIGREVSFVDMESKNLDGSPGVVRTGQVIKMDLLGDMEMLKIAEIDPVTFAVTEYDISADKVSSAQLDEFSQFKEFDQLSALNLRLDQMLQGSERSFANSMVGKQVSFVDMNSNNAAGNPGLVRTGQVTRMDIFGDREIMKISEVDPDTGETNEYGIAAENITAIINPFGS